MKIRALLINLMLISICNSYPRNTNADTSEIGKLVTPCESCHGIEGVSQNEQFPNLAGMSSRYISDALAAFREKTRECRSNIMCMLATNISESDAQRIGDYFAAKPMVTNQQPFNAEQAKLGKSIHDKLCYKCHRRGGSVADDDSGFLIGQWKPYLEQQFKELRSGKRLMPEKMQPKIAQLSDQDSQALLEYYASGQP